ncbi:YdcF family protein [Rhodococcus sovatensis]|uniref:YdcF family protein n=1 Tax=Rhodococcus sovatensis TaxID=1805840 RepID=A0ABZ2PQF2_9NOCA
MRISLSRERVGISIAASAVVVFACGGVATAQPVPLPIDPGALIASIAEPATPALYNAAQDNLVKGNYDLGLASLDALALASPSDANVVALQAFYRNAAEDVDGSDAALARLAELDPTLHDTVVRALSIIATSAESTVDFAPALDGPRTAIVALGFGLHGDGSMQDELVDRLESAAAAASASPESPVVVTGGNPQSGIAEADAMREWLVDNGVAAERIHVENKANSTVQNALFSVPIVESIGADSVVIATSANHVRRSISNFAIAGADVVGAVAADPNDAPEVPALGLDSRLGLTVDATKVIGIPRTY